MKEQSLNSTDKKVIDIFNDLGVPKNLAKTLMFISKVDQCRSADIEKGANLRQPEVSVAMQQLSDLGWITKTNQKKEGKGRPIYLYQLTKDIDDIFALIVLKFEIASSIQPDALISWVGECSFFLARQNPQLL